MQAVHADVGCARFGRPRPAPSAGGRAFDQFQRGSGGAGWANVCAALPGGFQQVHLVRPGDGDAARRERMGLSAKPGGGWSRKARLARVRLRADARRAVGLPCSAAERPVVW